MNVHLHVWRERADKTGTYAFAAEVLSRYEGEAFWSKVLGSFRFGKLRRAWADSLLADVKLELEDDLNELEGVSSTRGRVLIEEKAKPKDRLLSAQGLLERLLRAFANCVRCKVDNLQKQWCRRDSGSQRSS